MICFPATGAGADTKGRLTLSSFWLGSSFFLRPDGANGHTPHRSDTQMRDGVFFFSLLRSTKETLPRAYRERPDATVALTSELVM